MIARELPLKGLRTVVLGSTSGIGQATALALAQGGADVIVHGRSRHEEAHQTAQLIREAGRRASVLMVDLADREAGDRLVDQAWKVWDGLDAWVHFAGADTLTGTGAKLSFDEKLDHLWEVDVVATVRLCRRVGELMKRHGGGSILTMGWDQAETGMEGDSGELFAATKGAIMAFTRSLSLSLAPHVRVNAIAPGWIRTAWGVSAPQIWQDRVLRETPAARWGEPQDIANLVKYILSPEASFITGQILRVNGGAVR